MKWKAAISKEEIDESMRVLPRDRFERWKSESL